MEQAREQYSNTTRATYYQMAVTCFENAIKIADDQNILDNVWNNLGVSYYELGNLDKAVECFDNCLAIENKNTVLQKPNVRKRVYASDGKVVSYFCCFDFSH
jgi:tetratricopeptide (TPR) repeat protein